MYPKSRFGLPDLTIDDAHLATFIVLSSPSLRELGFPPSSSLFLGFVFYFLFFFPFFPFFIFLGFVSPLFLHCLLVVCKSPSTTLMMAAARWVRIKWTEAMVKTMMARTRKRMRSQRLPPWLQLHLSTLLFRSSRAPCAQLWPFGHLPSRTGGGATSNRGGGTKEDVLTKFSLKQDYIFVYMCFQFANLFYLYDMFLLWNDNNYFCIISNGY